MVVIEKVRKFYNRMYAEFQKSNPLRVPAWRLHRATEIVNIYGEKWNPKFDDPLTGQCVRHLLGRECEQEIKAAINLSTNAKFKQLKSEVEARILAGQTDLIIGSVTGLPPKIVSTYEKICFDIRDRLAFPDYILSIVIGSALGNSQPNAEYQLQYCAYFGGERALELMLFCQHATGIEQQKFLSAVTEASVNCSRVDGDSNRLVTRKAS